MSDDNTFAAGAGVMLAVALIGFSVACPSCYSEGEKSVRGQAIDRGLGEYRVDQKTQRVEFHWTVKASGTSVQIEREHPAASILEQEAKP